MVSPRWDAIMTLLIGAIYESLAYSYNLGHFSNASALWLGMRPSDIFVYIFLPPFLLDAAVRLDFYKLKRMMVGVRARCMCVEPAREDSPQGIVQHKHGQRLLPVGQHNVHAGCLLRR